MTSSVSLYRALHDSLDREERVTQVTVVAAPESSATRLGAKILLWPDGRRLGSLGSEPIDQQVVLATRELSATGPFEIETGPLETGGEALELFVELFEPPPKLVIVGAVHVAIHLIHFASRLGFRSIVVDAREVFATPERFPHADELILRWPSEALAEMPIHENTFCVFLTHDPKLDNPAIHVALERGAGYVGALGSKRTHAKRVEALTELGLSRSQIDSIHAPIGLNLGGRKPEEIALAIAAQILQARHAGG